MAKQRANKVQDGHNGQALFFLLPLPCTYLFPSPSPKINATLRPSFFQCHLEWGYRPLANDEQEKRILALLMLMSRLPGDCPSSCLLVSPPLMMEPLLGVSR
ncbi:Os11g0148900 [Oryza sativa Japonica Group]|uniref:Os11g0148900 protein n=1 Tax=Oryza sativa subsp. japonica TaxID=39947 RepID=A0A0N7KSF7_ORYSJ|nr:Os11g0148900 [Oryza sativa Japonica Group]